MLLDPLSIISGLIFMVVLLTVEGVSLLLSSRRQTMIARRRLLSRKADGTVAVDELRRRGRDASDQPLGFLIRIEPLRSLDSLLVRAGSTMPTLRFAAFMLLATLGIAALQVTLSGNVTQQSILNAMLLGVGLPIVLLIIRKSRRLRRFGQQLPDAIDTMVRSLRAGHPINTALQLVAEQSASPMSEEIGLVIDEMTYGLDLQQALERLGRRIDHEELHFMIAAIRIQHKSGGNLAEVLAGLSKVMRDRAMVLKKAKALSAEGRLSAVFLCSMPIVVAGMINLLNPDYYGKVSTDPIFMPGVIVIATLIAIGGGVIWQMVNIKV